MKLIDSGIFLQLRIKSGDLKAFEILFREYYNPLCHFALGFLDDQDTAEEIVQDFFYHFWENRHRIQIYRSLKAYLFGSVKNSSIKYLERQAIRRRYADRILTENNNLLLTGIETEFEARELKSEIDKALETLPERSREIFRMNRFEGLKYKEIALKLSVSVKTVEADMTRTLKVLRERIVNFYKEPLVKN